MELKHKLLFSLLYSLPLWLSAQRYSTGLVFDDAAYNATPRISDYVGSNFTDIPLQIDLTNYCPEVGNQGQIGSCVGWAAGYAAYTIAVAKMNGTTDKIQITSDAFSAMYLFNNVKKDCKKGSLIGDACQFLVKNGDLKAAEFDADVENCFKTGDDTQKAKARQYRIKDYQTLFGVEDSPEQKIFITKKMLATGSPVIIGMTIRKNFENLKEDEVWEPESGDTRYLGGHALCVVGYDMSRNAFRLMNSWGKSWGDNGFGWVSFEDYAEFCKYAYTLVPEETKVTDKPSTTLRGDFAFRHYIYGRNNADNASFKDAATSKSGGYTYITVKTDWRVGDYFQLSAKNMLKNEYVYVFSVDPTGTSNIHWPYNEEYDGAFDGLRNTPIVPSSDAEILIPGQNMGMVKETPGTDYLVILYADQPISDFKSIVRSMNYSQNNLEDKLIELLGSRVPPASSISYKSGSIGFSANVPKGSIVPLILEARGAN
jgi:hypothetical protein